MPGSRGERQDETTFIFSLLLWLEWNWHSWEFLFSYPANADQEPQEIWVSRGGLSFCSSTEDWTSFPGLFLRKEGAPELTSRLPPEMKSWNTCLLPTQNLLFLMRGGGKQDDISSFPPLVSSLPPPLPCPHHPPCQTAACLKGSGHWHLPNYQCWVRDCCSWEAPAVDLKGDGIARKEKLQWKKEILHGVSGTFRIFWSRSPCTRPWHVISWLRA